MRLSPGSENCQNPDIGRKKSTAGRARCAVSRRVRRYLAAGARSAGELAELMSGLAGATGADGRDGAAPVVMPDSLLVFGVTSRMPGGAAGVAGCVCAVLVVSDVPALFTLVLF